VSSYRSWVQHCCAVLLIPYFVILFLSMNAPDIPLPIPHWAKKKKTRHDGPLGNEISPSLRLVSPHHWPHPVWICVILLQSWFMLQWPSQFGTGILVVECIILPLHISPHHWPHPAWLGLILMSWFMLHWCSAFGAAILVVECTLLPLLLSTERHAYLAEIEELPESGFTPPLPPGIVHGTRSCMYSLYVHYVVKADVLDFDVLQKSQSPSFITTELPPRDSCRPSMIRGLPQRQRNQRLPVELTTVRHQKTFEAITKQHDCCTTKPSINEGAGANGLYCTNCQILGSEFAHEHSVDGSWHAVLSPSDAYKVCSNGWGERGPPICCRNICQNFAFAPEGWVFLYAPSTDAHVAVLATLLEASHDFVESGWEQQVSWREKYCWRAVAWVRSACKPASCVAICFICVWSAVQWLGRDPLASRLAALHAQITNSEIR